MKMLKNILINNYINIYNSYCTNIDLNTSIANIC